jgi:predicted nucleotidyltransferase
MTDNKQKILAKIFEKPEYHYHIRELARETDLNPNTISGATLLIGKTNPNLLIIEQPKILKEVHANVESIEYKREKQLFNLRSIYESGLLDFLIKEYDNPEAIVLLGSYARGEDLSNSDVDIAVITSKKENPDLAKFENKLKRKIHLLNFTYKQISDEFYLSLVNGIKLYGVILRK